MDRYESSDGRSPLVTLWGMIVVAGIAFSTHRYYFHGGADLRNDITQLKTWVQTATSKGSMAPEETQDGENATPPAPRETPSEHVSALLEIESEIWSEFQSQEPASESSSDLIAQQMDELEDRVSELAGQTEATEAQRRQSRLIKLRTLYASAQMKPAEYTSSFLGHCRQVVSEFPGMEGAAQADFFRIYHKHCAKKSFGAELRNEMQEFVKTYPDSQLGISLYSVVSRELWTLRRLEESTDVLEQGIELYKGHNGVSQLVNQLVDQGNRPPPAPSPYQGAFKYVRYARPSAGLKKVTASCRSRVG